MGISKPEADILLQLSQMEHVLKRPDSYIGSIEAVTQQMWVFDSETKMMAFRYDFDIRSLSQLIHQ